MSKQVEREDNKSGGLASPAPVPFGRRAIMVAVVFALVASALFKWAVVGMWKGEALEVVPAVAGQGLW